MVTWIHTLRGDLLPDLDQGISELEELDCLSKLIGLQVLLHANSSDEDICRTQKLEKNQSRGIRRKQFSVTTTCKTIPFLGLSWFYLSSATVVTFICTIELVLTKWTDFIPEI